MEVKIGEEWTYADELEGLLMRIETSIEDSQ